MSEELVERLNRMQAARLENLRAIAGDNADFLVWLRMLDRGLLVMSDRGVLEIKDFDFEAEYKRDPFKLSHAITAILQAEKRKIKGA